MADVYGYSGVKTALINSYAWDTAISWMSETETNYSTNTSYGNYSGTILATGNTETDEINSICDMAGNLREWTTEIYLSTSETSEGNVSNNNTSSDDSVEDYAVVDYRVVRGGSANITKVANSRIGQLESLSDPYWGFRVILYKS